MTPNAYLVYVRFGWRVQPVDATLYLYTKRWSVNDGLQNPNQVEDIREPVNSAKRNPPERGSQCRRLFNPVDPVLVLFLYMPHQPALALDLASGQLVFASLVGITSGLEFNPDRRAGQFHG
jgi:hypothetical protein